MKINEHEEQLGKIKEDLEEIDRLITHLQWSESGIFIVTCPETADFSEIGLRLEEILRIKLGLNHGDIKVIDVSRDARATLIAKDLDHHSDLGYISQVYEELAKNDPCDRLTIWIASRPITQGQGNALSELQPVIQRTGREVVLAPNTINQPSAWIDFYHRRAMQTAIFQDS